jgi:hypothetical protein
MASLAPAATLCIRERLGLIRVIMKRLKGLVMFEPSSSSPHHHHHHHHQQQQKSENFIFRQ